MGLVCLPPAIMARRLSALSKCSNCQRLIEPRQRDFVHEVANVSNKDPLMRVNSNRFSLPLAGKSFSFSSCWCHGWACCMTWDSYLLPFSKMLSICTLFLSKSKLRSPQSLCNPSHGCYDGTGRIPERLEKILHFLPLQATTHWVCIQT